MQNLRRYSTRSSHLFCQRHCHVFAQEQTIVPRRYILSDARQSKNEQLFHTTRRWKSSSSSLLHHFESEEEVTHHHREQLSQKIPDFNDSVETYKSKSTFELLRGYMVFQACRIPWFVDNAETVLRLSHSLLGATIPNALLKHSFFGHFCAGEDEQRIGPVVSQMKRNGVGTILDYAAESDIVPEDDNTKSGRSGNLDNNTVVHNKNINNTYDTEIEKQCDQHVEVFRECIRAVAPTDDEAGYAAVKVTALCNPNLLQKVSSSIQQFNDLYSRFDPNNEGIRISKKEFQQGYKLFPNNNSILLTDEIWSLLHKLKQQNSQEGEVTIDFSTWSMMFNPRDLPKLVRHLCKAGPLSLLSSPMTEEEICLWSAVLQRAETIALEAQQHNTRVLFDAEQFRYQPAIDSLVCYLQRNYNRSSALSSSVHQPIIYNTYQCYLKGTTERLMDDLKRAKRLRYNFGAKLVRGAYMESERELAKIRNYPSPIHDTIEDTHNCYDECVKLLLQQQQEQDVVVDVMLATHNQNSIEKAIHVRNDMLRQTKKGNDDPLDTSSSTTTAAKPTNVRNVSFAQLYGMSDHLTYNLAKQGFRVYKYVPYGPIPKVMPYLIRRAKENSSMMNGPPDGGGVSRELEMLKEELIRRATIH